MNYANITHSKELKDLFPDAEWWHIKLKPSKIIKLPEFIIKQCSSQLIEVYKQDKIEHYPTLTTDMLLEILPNYIRKNNIPYWLTIKKATMNYTIVYECNWSEWDKKGWPHLDNVILDKSLPNALSLMVKYLRDNGLLKEE